jgi:hypothetical protein
VPACCRDDTIKQWLIFSGSCVINPPIIRGLSAVAQALCKDEFLIMELGEKEKTRRIIGAVLLAIGSLCTIWGDKIDNLTLLKFGKTTAVVGIVIYFLGRIGKVLRKS